MNREDIKAAIAVMQAFLDGKTIQWTTVGGSVWDDDDDPIWNWTDFEFRIKPESREFWIFEGKTGLANAVTEFEPQPENRDNWIKVREVIDDQT